VSSVPGQSFRVVLKSTTGYSSAPTLSSWLRLFEKIR